jgi:hypothetical protein
VVNAYLIALGSLLLLTGRLGDLLGRNPSSRNVNETSAGPEMLSD